LASEVGICFLGLAVVDPSFDVNVTGSFVIFADDVVCVPDDQSSFKLRRWSRVDAPDLRGHHLFLRDNVHPTSNRPLF